MKLRALIYLCLLLCLPGCGSCRQSMKHLHSNLTGLHRQVTLYDAAGKPVRTWKGTFQVDDKGGSITFVTDDDLSIKLSGTWVVEELP